MKLQPNRNYTSDDVVQTPPKLARQLVAHFRPSGRIFEPCAGAGNFLRALRAHARTQSISASQKSAARQLSAFQHVSISAFRKAPPSVFWSEIQRGRDFFDWTDPVDWIVTNPPWSQVRRFLQHAMTLADHIVFLMTINHVWTKARLRDIRDAGFGLREIVLIDMPRTFPQSGFQLGAIYIARGWKGNVRLSDLSASRYAVRAGEPRAQSPEPGSGDRRRRVVAAR